MQTQIFRPLCLRLSSTMCLIDLVRNMIGTIIFGILTVVCLIYYVVMVTYAGAHTAFASVWLMAILVFAAITFVLGIIVKREIKLPLGIKAGFGIFCGICLLSFVIVEGFIVSKMISTPKNNLDYVIVLGAQVRGTKITNSLHKRLEKAKEYLEENPNTIAIVSGGQGEGEHLSEAQCMKDYLVKQGIASDRIVMEDKSKNTNENIECSMKIIQNLSKKDKPDIGIITNNFHVYRTVAVCKKKGYEVCGIASGSDKILFINYMVREFFAVVKYKVTKAI